MPKEFKTIGELVALLESRGVATDERTAGILMRESYYAVVNGYKGPFLDRRAMESASDDRYRRGTTFGSIYDLFTFDRMLRRSVMPYLMAAETIVKSAVVYSFCERNRGMLDYLDAGNYVSAKDMLVPAGFKGDKQADHDRNLDKLLRMFSRKNRPSDHSKPFVRHYVERYGGVPLWVLQNDLTFGNISHFYQLQNRGVQNATCRMVAEVNGNGERIGARDLLNALSILVGFRNICAHDDRLYCAHVMGHGFDSMVSALAIVLPPGEVGEMGVEVAHAVATFREAMSPEVLNDIFADGDVGPLGIG